MSNPSPAPQSNLNSFRADIPSDQAFFEQIRALRTFRCLARALPEWSKRHQCSVSINLTATPDGLAINLGLPESTPLNERQALSLSVLNSLADTEALMNMEATIHALTYFGGEPAKLPSVIEQLTLEAERFAETLHPRDPANTTDAVPPLDIPPG